MNHTKNPGNLYVVAAPSGAGKTSLVNALVERVSDLLISISYTTRPIRPGEVDGVNYHFVTQERFAELLAEGVFLEHATVYGYEYGTSGAWVQQHLAQGKDVILEIDWQGAQQIATLFDRVVSVFILPPSLEALQQRLLGRHQDTEEVIQQRIAAARCDISHADQFNYMIVNDNFDVALQHLSELVLALRAGEPVRLASEGDLLAQLLQTR